MPSTAPIAKKAKCGKKTEKLYCVVESVDGARIMSIDDANGVLCNLDDDRRSLAKMHFAGSLESAEKLQKVIEERLLQGNGELQIEFSMAVVLLVL